MVRLDRTGVVVPAKWAAAVATRIDLVVFRRAAVEFERLKLNGKRRRAGFCAYACVRAPRALPAPGDDFPPIWRRKKYVKKAIGAMSQRRCAYCQSPAGADQHGHVEHFRPKSLFPTLAYEWDNYFLACEACNTLKGNRWPRAGAYVRPDQGAPETRFVFDEQGGMSAAPGDDEAQVTIEHIGLDREGLREIRRDVIAFQLRLVREEIAEAKAEGTPVDRVRKRVRRLLMPELTSYSAAINQNVRRVWDRAFPGIPL